MHSGPRAISDAAGPAVCTHVNYDIPGREDMYIHTYVGTL